MAIRIGPPEDARPWLPALLLLLVLSFTGCGSSPRPAEPVPPAPESPLEVGFGRASLVWRVGAKPGQVGTNALPIRDQFFFEQATLLVPLVEQAPPDMLPDVTTWAHGLLDEQFANTQPGTYSRFFEPSVGVELPPNVRAVVLRRGEKKVALVRADLYIMHEQLHRRVAALIEEDTGIGRDELFLVGTHNHSVPHALSPAPGVWTRSDAFDPRHFVYVSRQIAAAVKQADHNLQQAELRVFRHSLAEVQHNIIGPNKVSMVPPGGTVPEEIDVGYPYDHFDSDLLMLRFDSPENEPIGFVFVFGMHPESLPEGHGMISGEWPLHVEDRVFAATGVESMWLPGPLGDVEADKGLLNPDHVFFRAGFDPMYKMVDIIADAVLSAWTSAGEQPGEGKPQLAQIARDVPGPADYPVPDLAETGTRLPMVRVVQDSTAMRMHLVRIGDALLIGLPAEITTDLALNIKSRVDPASGNLYQGYVFPSAPDWVRDRIENNFSTSELDAATGVPTPMIVSMTNGYFGYIVSRWEYENREHYRQSMTAFGPGTADHVATSVVALARELGGGSPASFTFPDWRPLDEQGVAEIQQFLAGLEGPVIEMARTFPAGDPMQIGAVVENPMSISPSGQPVRFSWIGGTCDMEPPRVILEQETPGGFQEFRSGPGSEIYLLFTAPDSWTASWNRPTPMTTNLRFRVEGVFRGPTAGASPPDPIWDPDGANQSYVAVSELFSVQ